MTGERAEIVVLGRVWGWHGGMGGLAGGMDGRRGALCGGNGSGGGSRACGSAAGFLGRASEWCMNRCVRITPRREWIRTGLW